MNPDAVERAVMAVVADVIGRPAGEMDAACAWGELGVDSLDFLSVLTDCEARFGCVIPDGQAVILTSPRALAVYLIAASAASASTA